MARQQLAGILKPTLRLMRLSAKSPEHAAQAADHAERHCHGNAQVQPGDSVNRHQNSADPTKPAKKPSQLFFGDTRGANLCLNLLPTR